MHFTSLAVAVAALVAAPTAADTQNSTAFQSTAVQNSTAFKYRSYSEIIDTILALETKFPQFVEVFTAQDRYGLPVRSELQCTRKGVQQPCLHYVIKITDEASLPDPGRPEVFFSGALHGDERVGPQAVTSLAELLVDHASRSDGNPWIKRLVKTRTVVIMPTTNSYGYDHNSRLELFVDPNRDFSYAAGWDCFHSMTARAVNEVWRAHMFQLAITFHAGMEVISYEWGSPNHQLPNDGGSEKSPDHQGQFYVGLGLSRFGGKFQQSSSKAYYEAGPMNDIVYPVSGGMEDWAYAGSWEDEVTKHSDSKPNAMGICQSRSFGGYPAEKSVYNNATHRAFNILIETSDEKQPPESDLGDSATLSDAALADFLPEIQTVGHVPRNVRIALMYIDVVQPYVTWKVSPSTGAAGAAMSFAWEVLGAFTVDKTQLRISKTPDFANAETTVALNGVTRWYHPDMKTASGNAATNKGLFKHDVTFLAPGVYYVQAVATVDQDWQKQGKGIDLPSPNVKPQTHVVNARTNPKWFYSHNGKTVQGRLEWKSPVVAVVVA